MLFLNTEKEIQALLNCISEPDNERMMVMLLHLV